MPFDPCCFSMEVEITVTLNGCHDFRSLNFSWLEYASKAPTKATKIKKRFCRNPVLPTFLPSWFYVERKGPAHRGFWLASHQAVAGSSAADRCRPDGTDK